MIQALLLAAVGIAIGLLIGALTPAAIAALYADALPIALATEPHLLALLTAALAGLLTMVLFVLWPLGRAASVSPAVLLRSHLSDERERSTWPYAAGSVAAGLALFALAIAASEERAITASISGGIVAAFILLTGFGLLLQRYAAKFRRAKPPSLALALASISGPGSLARSISVTLGLGLGLLIAVALIHRSPRSRAISQSTRPPIISSTSNPLTSKPSRTRCGRSNRPPGSTTRRCCEDGSWRSRGFRWRRSRPRPMRAGCWPATAA